MYLGSKQTAEMSFAGGAYNYKPTKFLGQATVAGMTKGFMIVAGIGDNTEFLAAGGESILRYHTTRKYMAMYPVMKDQAPSIPSNTTILV
jgi:hypothetical protein